MPFVLRLGTCYLPFSLHLSIVSSTLLSFRHEPPGQAISMATQELLRLAEANPSGIASLDPVNDLQLKSIDVVESSMRIRVLQDSLREFNCVHSPTFPEQVCACCWLICASSQKQSLKKVLFLAYFLGGAGLLFPFPNEGIKCFVQRLHIYSAY